MNLLDLPQPARELLALALTDPHAAAVRLRDAARQLLEAADALESGPPRDTGGATDRVRMNVVRNGQVIRSVDTN